MKTMNNISVRVSVCGAFRRALQELRVRIVHLVDMVPPVAQVTSDRAAMNHLCTNLCF